MPSGAAQPFPWGDGGGQPSPGRRPMPSQGDMAFNARLRPLVFGVPRSIFAGVVALGITFVIVILWILFG